MRKRARTDLCGGRPVMVVPTATAGRIRNGKSLVSYRKGRGEFTRGQRAGVWRGTFDGTT